jgi:hypothetical protein
MLLAGKIRCVMTLCSGDRLTKHTEICHEGSDCPLCEEVEAKAKLEDKVTELEGEVEELESQNAELRNNQ